MVFAAVLVNDKVPSGSLITGPGARRKTGWMGHGAGVCCNIMRLLRGKGLLLALRPEAAVGDSSGVNFVTMVVRHDDMQMYRQIHCHK